MKKILFILLSLFWAVYVQAASLSVDIHTPNPSKPCQFAKVYFLPDWNDKDFAFADQDEMPCTEVCPQKTDYDCKYGTESYVNGCGLTCSRCLECYGCEARGYTLSECPVNGICLNDCCNKLYKLESCQSGYIKENNGCRAENCTENASLCDSTTEKCVNGQCVEKDCTEYPDKCGSNQVCVDGECIAKDCNNTPSLCTATEKCQLQDGFYKCVCSPTCTDESDCSNGTETIANGCGGTCTVCKKEVMIHCSDGTTVSDASLCPQNPDGVEVDDSDFCIILSKYQGYGYGDKAIASTPSGWKFASLEVMKQISKHIDSINKILNDMGEPNLYNNWYWTNTYWTTDYVYAINPYSGEITETGNKADAGVVFRAYYRYYKECD